MSECRIGPLSVTVLPIMLAARLGLLYATYFWVIGLLAPYWQKWLDARGLSKAEIGAIAALMIWVKVIANPAVAGNAARLGTRRRLLFTLALLSVLSFQLYHWSFSIWAIAGVTILFQFALSPLVPLMESLTVDQMRRSGIDYGRVRTFGSCAFLVAALFGGVLLEQQHPDSLLPLVTISLLIIAGAALALPKTPALNATTRSRRPIRSCLREPAFLWFLAAAGFQQASHGAYYNFSTLHWTKHGISETEVGILWSLGVAVEIVFFLFSARLTRRLDPWMLLAMASIAGILRWTMTSLSCSLWVLYPAQSLHVFTFAFSHLGAMRYIEKWMPEELTPPAQGLYSAVGFGLLLGLATLGSGLIYDSFLGYSFLPMAAMCTVALFAALKLRQRARLNAARPAP